MQSQTIRNHGIDDQSKFLNSNLPIYLYKDKIISAIRNNPVVVIVGETGSGKTTQVPQYIHRYLPRGRIVVTQPRRVAATSLAIRVSEEMHVKIGNEVGYSIRFEDVTSPLTQIKFLTDGMLLRELLGDSTLSHYRYIILDEAHERSLRTDILFGVLKNLLATVRHADLRVIIMSATLDSRKFSSYFNEATVLNVEGRTFPVRTFFTEFPQNDYLEASIITCFQIHFEMAKGDILVFLTGQEEIESAQKILLDSVKSFPSNCDKIVVCPIYSSLPTAQQLSVFRKAPIGCRKIILSTNIAETSITIPGIKYIVDTGVVKLRIYNPRTGMESLAIKAVSKGAAKQRTGRAGRDAPGFCYRLYTEDIYEGEFKEETPPEIVRCSLSNVLLNMKAFGIDDVVNFDYLDRPHIDSIKRGLEELYALDALDNEGKITPLGRRMAEIPLSPTFSKTLLKGAEFGVIEQVIDVIACMSVDSIFYAPYEERDKIAEIKNEFMDINGDHLTLLNVLHCYLKNAAVHPTWMREKHIHPRNMKIVMQVRSQLREYSNLKGSGNPFVQNSHTDTPANPFEPINDKILKSFLSGFFANTALRHPDGSFRTIVGNIHVYLHPTSVLFGKKGVNCVLFSELIFTTKPYMRGVSLIQSTWLTACAPKYFGNI